jgi:hypothetical protein
MRKDVKNITDNITSDLNSLVKKMDVYLAQIPGEHDSKINEARGDISRIMGNIKKGDSDAVNEIMKKNGDSGR